MPMIPIVFRRTQRTRALTILTTALAMLSIGSNHSALAASEGCNAINALPSESAGPNGVIGRGLWGTFAAGDSVIVAVAPSANVAGGPYLEDYNDNRWATVSGGRATLVIALSQMNAWLGWSVAANSNPGGLILTIHCRPVVSSKSCPPGSHRGAVNGKVGCVCDQGGQGLCN
jgi:hypothetical protein